MGEVDCLGEEETGCGAMGRRGADCGWRGGGEIELDADFPRFGSHSGRGLTVVK